MTDAPHTSDAPTAPADGVHDPVDLLAERFRAAIVAGAKALGHDVDRDSVDPLITPSRQEKLGDFQSNAAMPLAKTLGTKPRDIAQAIVENLDISGLCEPVAPDAIAGPGFINVRLAPAALSGFVGTMDSAHLGLPPVEHPQTIVVDLCGVNLAKQMHVGHLRSTVIGDAVARLLERLGHTVVRQSHVGDWGLPIAMVTRRLMELANAGELDAGSLTLDQLNTIYRDAQKRCAVPRKAMDIAHKYNLGPKVLAELEAEADEAGEHLARAKATLIAMQSGDAEVVGWWERIYRVTMDACLTTCARLHANITDEHTAGESTYRDELGDVIRDLTDRHIAEEDDGALVVRVDGIAEPTLVRKRDGGFLYATTDMAAIRRRVQSIGASRVIYCVDARQGLHFQQVFGAAIKAGYAELSDDGRATGTATLEHAAFGNVTGPDGKPLKTRSGENVKLTDLLDEALARASAEIGSRDSGLSADERAVVADAVAIAAIKYADLSTERIKDYAFDFDRMVAFEGDTGPYLLYAYARIQSIFRKAGETGVAFNPGAPLAIDDAKEKSLALRLLRYPGVVRGAADAAEPHRLCGFLHDLAMEFSRFYDSCPVLKSDVAPAVRDSRLRLCGLTGRVLRDGLETLGIPVVDRM